MVETAYLEDVLLGRCDNIRPESSMFLGKWPSFRMIWSTSALSKEVEKGEVKLVWMEKLCFDLKTGKCGEDCDSEAIYLDSNSGPIADDYVPWAT